MVHANRHCASGLSDLTQDSHRPLRLCWIVPVVDSDTREHRIDNDKTQGKAMPFQHFVIGGENLSDHFIEVIVIVEIANAGEHRNWHIREILFRPLPASLLRWGLIEPENSALRRSWMEKEPSAHT